jgi:hypothetical protein
MPDVPVEVAPSVAPVATPPEDYQHIPAATPAAFGALPAEAAQRAGQQVEQAGLKIQDIWNQVASDRGTNQFTDGVERLLHGDPNGTTAIEKQGLLNLKGEDALNAGPLVAGKITALREQIKGGLQNVFQQQQFEQETRRQMQYRQGAIDSHLD